MVDSSDVASDPVIAVVLSLVCLSTGLVLLQWLTFLFGFRQQWWGTVKRMFASLCACWQRSDDDKVVRSQVANLMDSCRLRYCWNLATMFSLVGAPCAIALTLVSTYVILTRSKPFEETLILISTSSVYLLTGSVCCLLHRKPGLLSLRLCRCLYVLWMVRLTFCSVLDATQGQLIETVATRIVFSLAVLETRTVLPCNIIFFVASIGFNIGKNGMSPTMIGAHVLSTALVVINTFLLEASMLTAVRANLNKQSALTFERAAENLLSGMCDAVVRLDSQLAVIGPARKLSGLLLQTASLEGAAFPTLIQGETERLEFLSFMRRGTDAIANTMNTHFRDSTHTRVPVQIFHAVCMDSHIKGGRVHMLGIRDIGEERVADLGAVWRSESASQPHDLPDSTTADTSNKDARDMHKEVPAVTASPLDLCSSAGSSDDMSGYASNMTTGKCTYDAVASKTDASIWVELETAQFNMMSCTPCFISSIGSLAVKKGRSFLSVISNKDKESVRRALQRAVNCFWSCDPDEEFEAVPLKFGMQTAFGKRVVRASFCVDLSAQGEREMGKLHIEAIFRPKARASLRGGANVQRQLQHADINLSL